MPPVQPSALRSAVEELRYKITDALKQYSTHLNHHLLENIQGFSAVPFVAL